MSNEMTVRKEPQALTVAAIMANPDMWRVLSDMAATIAQGGDDFVPRGFNSVQKVKAAMLVAVGLRLDPVAALQHMHVVKGKVGFSVHLYLALCIERIPTFRYEVLENTPERARAVFQRSPGHAPYECEYTIEQAQKAGLVKSDSGWANHPADMLLSMVVRRGCRRVAPDALVGMPGRPADDGDGDGDGSDYEPTSGAVVVEGAGEVEAAVTKSLAPAPAEVKETKPADSPASAKQVFLNECERRGIGIDGRALGALLKRLLTVDGAPPPAFKSSGELTTHDWRMAYAKLAAEPFGAGKEADAQGADAPPDDDSPPHDDAPPADEPSEVEQAGADALADQMADLAYLLDISRSLEHAWKQPGSCVKEAPAGSGKWWFVNKGILSECGRVMPNGAAKSVPLFETNNAEWVASAPEVRAISAAVLRALDTAANRGKPVVGR